MLEDFFSPSYDCRFGHEDIVTYLVKKLMLMLKLTIDILHLYLQVGYEVFNSWVKNHEKINLFFLEILFVYFR